MKNSLAFTILMLACTAYAQQTEGQAAAQGAGSTTVTTSGPASVTGASVTATGNSVSTDTSSKSGATSTQQVQNQSQSQSASTSTAGAAVTNGGNSQSASGAATSSSATTGGTTTGTANGNATTGNVDNRNQARNYALGVNRGVSHTLPANCTKSSAWSVDILVAGGSRSTSEMDPYCIRREIVSNLCQAAANFYVEGDLAEYVQARKAAATLECSDERVHVAFGGQSSCAAAMEVGLCAIPVRVSTPVVAAPAKEVVREVVRVERVEVPVYIPATTVSGAVGHSVRPTIKPKTKAVKGHRQISTTEYCEKFCKRLVK